MKISQVNLYIARAQSTLAKRETNLCKQILFPFRRRNLFVLLFCWVFFFLSDSFHSMLVTSFMLNAVASFWVCVCASRHSSFLLSLDLAAA